MSAFSLPEMRARAITASRDALTMLIGDAVLNEIPVSKREPRARAEHLEKPMRLTLGALLAIALTLMAAWNTKPPGGVAERDDSPQSGD